MDKKANNIPLKHSVIKEDPNELIASQARYQGAEIDDQDLDIYSK
jgi:hypothetical protein